LLGAHDDSASTRNCLAPARLHITEHKQPAGTQLDHLARGDIVHQFGTGDVALHILNNGDQCQRAGETCRANQAGDRGEQAFHVETFDDATGRARHVSGLQPTFSPI